ncbi:MAG: hypothetical protein Q8P67_01650, partial [archaeon]|nr:hypothetical protein [archaeon]
MGGCANEATWRCANTVVDEVIEMVGEIMDGYPHPWEIEKLPFRNDMCSNIRLKIPGIIEPNAPVV